MGNLDQIFAFFSDFNCTSVETVPLMVNVEKTKAPAFLCFLFHFTFTAFQLPYCSFLFKAAIDLFFLLLELVAELLLSPLLLLL